MKVSNLFFKLGKLFGLLLALGGALAVFSHLLETSGATYQGGPPGEEWYTSQLGLYKKNALLNYTHLVSACLFSILAPLQFWEKFRKKNQSLHRKMGKLFIISSIIVSMSGLAISFIMPFGRNLETLFAIILFIMVSIASYKGIYFIKLKKVQTHRFWMFRLFSWSMSIVTMRLVLGVFYEVQPWDDRTWFSVALYIALAINASFCELWIRIQKSASG